MPTGIETPKITPHVFPKTEYVRVNRSQEAQSKTVQGDAIAYGNKTEEIRNQAQANLDATKARADVPGWALGLAVAGFAAGLIYANKQGSGFWGYVGYGIAGNIIFSVPYTFYYYSNLQKK